MDNKGINEIELLTRKEVANLLKLNLRTIDKRVANQDLQAYKMGAAIRFKKCDVIEFIDKNLLKGSA